MQDIIAKTEEQEKEEDVQVPAMKAETIKVERAKEIETTKSTKELDSTIIESVEGTAAMTVKQAKAEEATARDSYAADTEMNKYSKEAKANIKAEGNYVREMVAMVMAELDAIVKAIMVGLTLVGDPNK